MEPENNSGAALAGDSGETDTGKASFSIPNDTLSQHFVNIVNSLDDDIGKYRCGTAAEADATRRGDGTALDSAIDLVNQSKTRILKTFSEVARWMTGGRP